MPTARKFFVLVLILALTSPALAAGRELAPRGGGQTSYHAQTPLVAFAGNRFLTVWRESRGTLGTFIMGAFSDASGRRVTDLAFPIIPAPGTPQHLISAGDGFVLFSLDGASRTVLTEIDLDGRALRTRTLALPRSSIVRAAWNGTYFLVALRRPIFANPGAEALLLDRNGDVVRGGLPLQPDAFAFAIAPDDVGFTTVATGHRGVFAYRVTNGGAMTEALLETANPDLVWMPAVAKTANGETLAVWTLTQAHQTQVKSALLARDGTAGETRVVHTFDSGAVRPLALLRRGEEYVLAYDRLRPDHSLALETLTFGAAAAPVVTVISESVTEPAAVANGGTLFASWTPAKELPFRIVGTAIAPTGTVELLARARTRQTQPALAAGGGRYVAAWTDITGTAAFVRATSLGLDGEPLTDNIIHPAYLSARELAWNGTEYLALEQRNEKLLATRITPDGRPMDAEPIALAAVEEWWSLSTSLAWAGDRWVIVWATYDELRFATVSRAGIPSAPRTLGPQAPRPQEWWHGYEAVSVAAYGATVLLAWTEEQRPPCYFPVCGEGLARTFATRLSVDGELRDAAPLEVPAARTLSLATSGHDFLLLGDTTATVIDAAATPRAIASRELFNWPAAGDVTWDGTSYAVALRYRGTRWHLAVLHLDRNGNDAGIRRGTETLAPDELRPPSIAAVIPYVSLVAVQEGDARDGMRAAVYEENEMAQLPAPPSAPRQVRVTPSSRVGRHDVTWEPATGTNIELYVVERQAANGTWVAIAEVRADAPLRANVETEHVRVRAFNAGGLSEPAFASTAAKRRAARK